MNDNRYAEMRAVTRVRERALFLPLRTFSELELQARWFDGDFGRHFVKPSGDKIDILQFGIWNREAGPDFRDAAISVNGREPIRGSIEFDLADRNWEAHGHATNPAFEDTVLHVFVDKGERDFFTRTKSNREVVQLRIDPNALPESLSANVPLARPGRCQAPLKDLPEDRVRSILNSAAQFRLRQKAARIGRKIDNHGRDETLFQEIAAALGYKQNRLPFTLLAQRVSLKVLREKINDCEALLFGAAGFLKATDLDVYKSSTREYVRQLWDRWWPHRDEMQRLILPAKLWRLSSSRPLNHPQRRVAALAVLAREWPAFRRSMERAAGSQPSPTGKGGSFSRREQSRMKGLLDFFSNLNHPFWKFHYTLTAEPSPKEMALIGESRVTDILANVLFPFWLSEDACAEAERRRVDLWPEYIKLPARLSNRRLETAATRLLGNDPSRAQFLKSVAHQQGLLQIYEDFCMQDNSDCEQCPFPEQMKKWT